MLILFKVYVWKLNGFMGVTVMVSVTDKWIEELLIELELVTRDGDDLVYRCGAGLILDADSIAYLLRDFNDDVSKSYKKVLDEIKVSILSEIEDDFLEACMDFWEGTPETYVSDMEYIKDFVWRIVRVDMDETSLRDTRICMNLFYFGKEASMTGLDKNLIETDLNKLSDGHELRWLVESQGYKMEDVMRTYETCETKSVFMRSLVSGLMESDADVFGDTNYVLLTKEEEVLRDSLSTNLITFFVEMRWGDLMDVMDRDCYIKLGPRTRVGIYNLFADSLYEIRLENGVIFDKSYVLMEYDGIGGIRDFLGKSDEFYRDTYYR